LDPPRVGAWSLRRLDAAWLMFYLDGIVVHTLQAIEDAVLSPFAISRKYLSRTRDVGWKVQPGALPNHPLADFFRGGSPTVIGERSRRQQEARELQTTGLRASPFLCMWAGHWAALC
jgi:hypothetical protein